MGRPKVLLANRFWDKVAIKDPAECWEWLGSKNPGGYGMIWNSERGKPMGAHIAAWEIHNGTTFPIGMVSLHSCNNAGCVNPAHIHPGTQKENVEQAWREGRLKPPPKGVSPKGIFTGNGKKTHCKNGHEFSYPAEYRKVRRCYLCENMRRNERRKMSGAEVTSGLL